MKRRATVRFSSEIIIEKFGLPLGAEVIDARVSNFGGGWVELVLSGESLPECEEGAYPIPYEI